MSFRDPRVLKFESKLKREVFDLIDAELEVRFGHRYPLRPNRPEEGETSNPEHDGLFRIGAAFSPGYGSEHGAGYIIDARLATFSDVPHDVEKDIETFAVERLRTRLAEVFPDRELEVRRDGHVFKIIGDLRIR